jgi:hypothetical protein
VTKKPIPTSGADQSAEKASDQRSSLDKLADFARRIIAVPKKEIPPHQPTKRPKKERS